MICEMRRVLLRMDCGGAKTSMLIKIRSTVKVIGGPVYRAHEIERLHYGPKPA